MSEHDQIIRNKANIHISRKPQQLNDLWSIPTSSLSTEPQSSGQQFETNEASNVLREECFILKNMVEIQTYNSIVKAINPKWDLKVSKNWGKLYGKMMSIKQSHFLWDLTYFKTTFYMWTEYYAQVFIEPLFKFG